jgi:YidC/Oxa1 family membrane protein insertase
MEKRTVIFVSSVTIAFLIIKAFFAHYEQAEIESWKKAHPEAQVTASKNVTEKKAPEQKKPEAILTKSEPLPQQSQYYVLENEYMQLVFSSVGGAIAEINLPFPSKSPKSVVLPIAFDQMVMQAAPKLATFPLHEATTYDGKQAVSSFGGYYPLLRRGDGTKLVSPEYYTCAIVSEYPEVARQVYEVTQFSKREIVLQAVQHNRRIVKRFTLPENGDLLPYTFQLEVKIEGDAEGLWLTSGVPEVEWISGAASPSIKYHLVRGRSASCEKVDIPKERFMLTSIHPDWISNSNGFFGVILDPLRGAETGFRVDHIAGNADLSRLFFIDRAQNRFPLDALYGVSVAVPLEKQAKNLHFRIFSGPFSEKLLKKVDLAYAQETDGHISDYQLSQTFHGWFAFISEPFARFLFFVMKLFYSLFGSWALSIVLITIVLRLLMYPLNAWSMSSVSKMQALAPELKVIQEKYKKDPKKSQAEIVELYRKYGVNPVSGCLPLLIQMPFLIGMFDLLKSAFELRGASCIPGWIDDLSAPDVLFSWGFSIPFIGNELHLLPVILGGIMFVQQQMMSGVSKNPAEWTDQQRQQKAASNIMTVVFTVMFYHFPSGLNIYWISATLLGIFQQWWTNKTIKVEKIVEPKKRKKFLP